MSSPELSTSPCNQEVPARVQRSRPNCAWEVGIIMLPICLSETWEEPAGGRGLKSASPLYHPDPRALLNSGSAWGHLLREGAQAVSMVTTQWGKLPQLPRGRAGVYSRAQSLRGFGPSEGLGCGPRCPVPLPPRP